MASLALFDRHALRAALLGGLVGGSLDILYAFISYAPMGVAPIQILHAIASGWLGKAAYAGGIATATLGLISHMAINCVAAAMFVMASRRIDVLTRRPILSGAVFGLGMFIVMNYVVVPLSAAVVGPPRGVHYPLGLLVHMFLIGVPIALFARQESRRPVELKSARA
jgi:hypothetical protein